MDDALDDIERFTAQPLPAASDASAVAAQARRLASVRAMSAAAHADPLPPEHANRVSAKLVVGVKMLRDVARDMKLSEPRRALVDALLFKAQQQARNVHHNGMAPNDVAALECAPLTRAAAWTVSDLNQDGSALQPLEVVVTAKVDSEPEQWGVMAHESVHEGQYSIELGDEYPRTPTHPEPPDHARPGFLTVQRSLPLWGWEDKPALPRKHPLFYEHYRTNPLETQTRKPVFERSTWQVHVPAHTLNDPRKLAPRLARLAYDFAYAAEGPRAELKQAAARGDTASREHYETHTFARWQSPGVALRRASVSVAAGMAAQASVATGSSAPVRASRET